MGAFQYVVFGLETGSYIAIATVGFSLIYGIVNMINFAYGEYMTIGAYVGFLLMDRFGINVWLLMLGVVLITAVLGWGVSRGFFTPIHDTGPIPLLLTSVGLGFVLRNVFRFVFGVEREFVDLKFVYLPKKTFRIDAGPVNFFVTTDMLLVIATAIVVFGCMFLLLTRTDLGIAMRATASNDDLARLSGIRTDRIRQYTWVLASGLAGLSGVLVGLRTQVSPEMGLDLILVILAAAILGGVGSLSGAFAGAYLLGLTMSFTGVGFQPILEPIPVLNQYLLPVGDALSSLPRAMAFVVLIVVLLIKPSGIAGREVEP